MTTFKVDPWFSHLAGLGSTGVMMFDPDGVIQFVSGPARKILHVDVEDHVEDCIEPLADELEEIVTQCGCCEEGDGLDELSRIVEISAPVDPKQVRINATKIELEDCQGTLILIQDLSIESQMQRDLLLASRFRNVGQLYQSMAHDLRNPVGLIRIYADLLQGTFDLLPNSESTTVSKQREHLDVIVDAIKTMDQSLDLLFDELVVSENDSGVIDVRSAVAAVIRLAEAQAKRQKVTVVASLPGDTVHLHGNESQFRLALLNIANNALQAMPDGGELRITLELLPDKTEISFADNGKGICKDLLNRVFDKYYSTKRSGTGIGLHIARETIEELGGAIGVESLAGEGSNFSITLPRYDRE